MFIHKMCISYQKTIKLLYKFSKQKNILKKSPPPTDSNPSRSLEKQRCKPLHHKTLLLDKLNVFL